MGSVPASDCAELSQNNDALRHWLGLKGKFGFGKVVNGISRLEPKSTQRTWYIQGLDFRRIPTTLTVTLSRRYKCYIASKIWLRMEGK